MVGAPPPPDEAERLQELRALDILDSGPEAAFDRLTELASLLCDTPIALVSLIDGKRQWFKSRVGLDVQETPRDQAFCGYAIHGRETLVVPDATLDPRFADNALVLGHPHIRFYAGAPIAAPGGHRMGSVCVIDSKPRDLSDTERRALRLLADQAEELFAMRAVAMRLHEAAAALGDHEDRLVNSLSHEIGTPLTPIRLSVARLRRLVADADAAAELDRIDRNARRIERVLHGAAEAVTRLPGWKRRGRARPEPGRRRVKVGPPR